MKLKNGLLVLSVILLAACNNQTKVEEAKTINVPEENQVETAAVHQEAHAGTLSLNKGEKWQADESTRRHVQNLKTILGDFDQKANPDVEAHHAWAGALQQELEQLVKDCRMKGEDHEALHQWLEPLLKNVAALQKTTTLEAAKKQAGEITTSVQQFDQYFK